MNLSLKLLLAIAFFTLLISVSATAASTTPLTILDLENAEVQMAVIPVYSFEINFIGDTDLDFSNGFVNFGTIPGVVNPSYHDSAASLLALPLIIQSAEDEIAPEFTLGDTITVAYDGNQALTVHLPPLDGSSSVVSLFVAADGSTYYGYDVGGGVLVDLAQGAPVVVVDTDNDAIEDATDNCPLIYNPLQEDSDGPQLVTPIEPMPIGGGFCGNGICDVAEYESNFPCALDCPDAVGNACDNCRFVHNPNQTDLDGNSIGDACDPSLDLDGDKLFNENDLCPFTPSTNAVNVCDNAPAEYDGTYVFLQSRTITPPNGIEQELLNQLAFLPDPFHALLFIGPGSSASVLIATEKEDLNALGVTLQDYVAHYAYYATIPKASLNSVNALGFVKGIGAVIPEDKISTEIRVRRSVVQGHNPDNTFNVTLNFFEDEPAANQLAYLQSTGFMFEELGGNEYHVTVSNYFDILLLAKENSVFWVSEILMPFGPNKLNNAKPVIGVTNVQNTYGFFGDGYNVSMTEFSHPRFHTDFSSRLILDGTTRQRDHPTSVAGIVLGDGSSGGPQGVLPLADTLIALTAVKVRMESRTYGNAQIAKEDYGAIFNTNSWGPYLNCYQKGDYDKLGRHFDRAVTELGIPIIYASGNARGPSGDYATADIVEGPWPHSCESDLFSLDNVPKNDISVGRVSNAFVVAGSSSAGPSSDLRLKPDITAPGSGIQTANGTSGYRSFSGTSASAPFLAGVVGMLIEAFEDFHSDTVWPSTLKAILIHTAIDINVAGPDYYTGYGVVQADQAVDVAKRADALVTEDYVSGTRDEVEYALDILPATTQFKATLVWDDEPASYTARRTLINDLNLVLESPSGDIYYPWDTWPDYVASAGAQQCPFNITYATSVSANGTSFTRRVNRTDNQTECIDTRNNVEQVVAFPRGNNTAIEAGTWTARVNVTRLVTDQQNYSIVIDPKCPVVITQNTTLDQDIDCSYLVADVAVSIQANNVVLDCDGHSIIGSDAPGTGVYIGIESRDHQVTIQNCDISNFDIGISADNMNDNQFINNSITAPTFSSTSHGIFNSNGVRGLIENNTIIEVDGLGIRSDNHTSLIVRNNHIENTDGDGISASGSAVTIADNNISQGSQRGIVLSGFSNVVQNNTLNDISDIGIFISGFNHDVLDNALVDMDNGIIWIGTTLTEVSRNNLSQIDTLGISMFGQNFLVENNTINMFGGSSGGTGISVAGGSRDGTVQMNNISYTSFGVRLHGPTPSAQVNDIAVLFNDIQYANTAGVSVEEYATENNVSNNTVSPIGSDSAGIRIQGSSAVNTSANQVRYNTLIGDGSGTGIGVQLYLTGPLNYVQYNNGTDLWAGIKESYSSFNVITDNTLTNSGLYGIYSAFSTSSQIENNKILIGTVSTYGIFLDGNIQSDIQKNDIQGDGTGIFSRNNKELNIENNIIQSTTFNTGIDSDSDVRMDIHSNHVAGASRGMEFTNMNDSNIEGNTLIDNKDYGIRFVGYSSNITDNGIRGSNDGIRIISSAGVDILLNTIDGTGIASDGIYAFSSNNLSLLENAILIIETGIDLDEVNESNISHNTINESSETGILLTSSNNNLLENNTVSMSATSGSACVWLTSGSTRNEFNNNTLSNPAASSHGFLVEDQSLSNTFEINYVNVTDESSNEWQSFETPTAAFSRNLVANLTLVRTGLEIAFIDFNGTAIKGVLSSEAASFGTPSTGEFSLDKYVNLSNTTGDSWIFIAIPYTDAEVTAAGIDEDSLRIWKYNETAGAWTNESFYNTVQYGVDTTGNVVFANITNFASLFSVFGSEPVPVLVNEYDSSLEVNVTVSTTSEVNITISNTTDPNIAIGNNTAGDIGIFVNIAVEGDFEWAYAQFYYDEADLGDVDESTLRLYRWNETLGDWEVIADSGVNTVENYVWGNLTEFSIFAPLGVVVANVDSDNDGVLDALDLCSATVIPELSVPSEALGVNRFALTNNDLVFDTALPKGKNKGKVGKEVGPKKSFTLEGTRGCSCEQIVALQNLGEGHIKQGCSSGILQTFIDMDI